MPAIEDEVKRCEIEYRKAVKRYHSRGGDQVALQAAWENYQEALRKQKETEGLNNAV